MKEIKKLSLEELEALAEGEKNIQLYSPDDTGNAEILARLLKDKAVYSPTEKTWYFWNGTRWKADEGLRIYETAEQVFDVLDRELSYFGKLGNTDAQRTIERHIRYSRSRKGVEACEKSARHKLALPERGFDADDMLFNVKNMTVVLDEINVQSHDPRLYMSKSSPVRFDPNAKASEWLNFLSTVFNNDLALIKYVQRAVGYTLTGLTDEQCLFFAYGNGSNGKTTFLNVISDIMGGYAANINPQSLLMQKQNGGSANPDIARLSSVRLVTAAEPNEGERFNEGLIKQLTGGDTITARFLYGREFQFKPRFKLWISANNKPAIRGTDYGIWRRIRMIPFSVTIPAEKADRDLPQKLKAEYEGILRWAIEGAWEWRREGLGSCSAVRNSVSEYRLEMDSIARFLKERTRQEPSARVQSSVLYKAYCAWCEENGYYAKSIRKFGAEVGRLYQKGRSNGLVYYLSVCLNT